jgi:hypothetical protein
MIADAHPFPPEDDKTHPSVCLTQLVLILAVVTEVLSVAFFLLNLTVWVKAIGLLVMMTGVGFEISLIYTYYQTPRVWVPKFSFLALFFVTTGAGICFGNVIATKSSDGVGVATFLSCGSFTCLAIFLTFVYMSFAEKVRESGDRTWLTPTRPHLADRAPVVADTYDWREEDHAGFQSPYDVGYDMSSMCYPAVEAGELEGPAEGENRVVVGSVEFPSEL